MTNVYARILFGLSVVALGLSVVFFLPIAAAAWLLEKDREAWLVLCLIPVIPAAAAASGLVVLAMQALAPRREARVDRKASPATPGRGRTLQDGAGPPPGGQARARTRAGPG